MMKYLLLILLFSCSQKYLYETDKDYINQKLQVTIKNINNIKNKTENFIVYTSINRKEKRALLNGVGKFDKHIFTLEVINKKYNFINHIERTKESGDIENFKEIILDKDFLFNKLDIKEKQPIILNEGNLIIFIKEQK